jgi:hypothetical protein
MNEGLMHSERLPRDRHIPHIPEHEPRNSQPPQGQVVMGPGFYVWDESPREAREWATELAVAHVIASS